jgi:REP element-mobilizing transposase RayT
MFMIIAYHGIFCAYGFWLPNDPRGSWSDFVASWDLFRYGGATKVDTRRSVAGVPHDNHVRMAAKQALRFPAVVWTEQQMLAISQGFQRAIEESQYQVCACAILPEHVHLVVLRHERKVERIVGHLKTRATQQLMKADLWPHADRPVWAEGCWKVFINDEAHLAKAIVYAENNPVKEGRDAQRWPFVTPWKPV